MVLREAIMGIFQVLSYGARPSPYERPSTSTAENEHNTTFPDRTEAVQLESFGATLTYRTLCENGVAPILL